MRLLIPVTHPGPLAVLRLVQASVTNILPETKAISSGDSAEELRRQLADTGNYGNP